MLIQKNVWLGAGLQVGFYNPWLQVITFHLLELPTLILLPLRLCHHNTTAVQVDWEVDFRQNNQLRYYCGIIVNDSYNYFIPLDIIIFLHQYIFFL